MADQNPQNDMSTFIQELEEYEKQIKGEHEDAATGTESAPDQDEDEQHESAEPEDDYAHAAPTPQYVIPPEILEMQRNQTEISRQLAEAIATKKGGKDKKDETDFDFSSEALTAEEEESYKESAPVIRKVARSLVADAMKQYDDVVVKKLRDENQVMAAQLAQYSQTNVVQQEQVANAQLQSMTAGVIPDYNSFIIGKKWQSYLKKEAPNTGGISFHTIAKMHASNGNLSALAKMMVEAEQATGGVPAQKLVAPGSASTAQQIPRSRDVSKALPYSRYKEAMDLQARGKMTLEEFNKIDQAYDSAALVGRVDYEK